MKYNLAIFLFLFYLVANLSAEDGSKLWLRCQANPVSKTEAGLTIFSTVVVTETSNVLVSAIDELKIASSQMTRTEIHFSGTLKRNCLLIGAPRNKYVQSLHITNTV